MSEFKVAKTKKDISEIIDKIENRLIIKKVNDIKGKLFFEYDNKTRLEISNTNNAYFSKTKFTDDNTKILIDNIVNLNDANNINAISINKDNLELNVLIYDGENIGVVTEYDETTNMINIVRIYQPKSLTWIDC